MNDLSAYLQFGRQERKLFFMDSRYPTLHLTVSWANASGEIDVHLTRELPDGTKIHGSIFRFPESSVADFFSSLVPRFEAEFTSLAVPLLREIRPIRPGWLGRKGYLIFWLSEEEHKPWMLKFARRRGKNKYRIYPETINSVNHAEDVFEHLYEPAILHEIAARGSADWIQALRVKGKKKRRRSTLYLKPMTWPDGRVRWIAIDGLAAALLRSMSWMEDLITRPLDVALPGILDRVYGELRLHELGIERDRFTSSGRAEPLTAKGAGS
jgi:hypothetical protein